MESADLSVMRSAIERLTQRLRRQQDCPRVRQWRTAVSTYEHAIALWATARPNTAQVEAMKQCVADLSASVFAASRDVGAPTREALVAWASER